MFIDVSEEHHLSLTSGSTSRSSKKPTISRLQPDQTMYGNSGRWKETAIFLFLRTIFTGNLLVYWVIKYNIITPTSIST
jgi:hypothetical protein